MLVADGGFMFVSDGEPMLLLELFTRCLQQLVSNAASNSVRHHRPGLLPHLIFFILMFNLPLCLLPIHSQLPPFPPLALLLSLLSQSGLQSPKQVREQEKSFQSLLRPL